jgi:hypothetical protein
VTEVERLRKALALAQKQSLKWADRRRALPPGSSRARVTTANANWAQAAEHRDRISDLLDKAIAAESATSK